MELAEKITEHIRTIWAGTPAELDYAAQPAGLLPNTRSTTSPPETTTGDEHTAQKVARHEHPATR